MSASRPRRSLLAGTALAALALATAWACVNPGNMARPVFMLSAGDGFCLVTLAMEGHREVWGEGGCEGSSSGWQRRGTATEGEAARIADAFAALPAPDNSCPTPLDGGFPAFNDRRLTMLRNEGSSHWLACPTADGGFTPPFDEAVDAMEAIARLP